MAVKRCTDETDRRRLRCRSVARDMARRPSLTPCPLPSQKAGRARVIFGCAHVAKPSRAPAMSARAAKTSYISQKVAGSWGTKTSTPRQSTIRPCTEILRLKPSRAHMPGGPSKPLALPAAARSLKDVSGADGAPGGKEEEEEARPHGGGEEDPASGAAPAPRGAYVNPSYDAYGAALHLVSWFVKGSHFARDIAYAPGVKWQPSAAPGRSDHHPQGGLDGHATRPRFVHPTYVLCV